MQNIAQRPSILKRIEPKTQVNKLMTHFPVTFEASEFDDDYLQLADIETKASEKVIQAFSYKIEHQASLIGQMRQAGTTSLPMQPDAILTAVVRNLLIRCIDKLWQEHLLHIDHLRTEVHLRAVGQKDPLLEFKHEAFSLFDSLTSRIKLEVAHALFKFEMVAAPKEPAAPRRVALRPKTNLSLMPED